MSTPKISNDLLKQVINESMNQPIHLPIDQAMKRIGIFGGTFDPIHLGHIHTAKQTALWLNLDKLFILPSHLPPHKTKTSANTQQRLNMVELVCRQDSSLTLDKRELNKNTPSYTVETLQEIKNEYPQAQLFFIIGMDSLLTFSTWHKHQEILSLCHLVVNSRPSYTLDKKNIELTQLLANHQINHPDELQQQKAGGILIHDTKEWHISSTEIRKRIKNNLNCDDLLLKCVISYINKEELYR
ncbi:MAG: nicotinate-nucleotide adenylyltransferase [Alteromonadaceae bacterium]|jgi:nicotinate-nucleotide adenylyltransferase